MKYRIKTRRPRTDRAHSTAPTKQARRRENWGRGRNMPPTSQRRFTDRGHLAPAAGVDRSGGRWLGAHNGPPPRKRTTRWRRRRARVLARTGWRAFIAQRGIYKPAMVADESHAGALETTR